MCNKIVMACYVYERSPSGLFVDVIGRAECRWCEHIKQQRVTFRGCETFLDERIQLVESLNSKRICSMTAPHNFFKNIFPFSRCKHNHTSRLAHFSLFVSAARRFTDLVRGNIWLHSIPHPCHSAHITVA